MLSTAGAVSPFTWKPRRPTMLPNVARLVDVIAGARERAVVAGRQEQEAAALAFIGPGVADVGDVVEPEVVDQAQHVGRALHHDRAVLQVEPGERVDALGVGGEEQRSRIHQRLEDRHRLVVRAEAPQALALRGLRRGGHRGQHRLHAALEVEVVVQLVDGRLVGEAVEERQRPQPRLEAIGDRDRLRDVGRHRGARARGGLRDLG